jgi:hypothetical protein
MTDASANSAPIQQRHGNRYLSREQWYSLPWELRRRWNLETLLDRLPPSQSLLDDVAAALAAVEFEELLT